MTNIDRATDVLRAARADRITISPEASARALDAAGLLAPDLPSTRPAPTPSQSSPCATTPKETTLSDPISNQFSTDKVREIAAAMRASMHREDGTCRDAEFLGEMSGHIAALEALLPGPTLADMSMEDREECRWMRADVAGVSTRYVIADPRDDDNDAAILVSEDGRIEWVFPEHVVPRPDLPRMPWTDTEKPAPAPALPDGWRLADHEGHGRVIVITTTPDDEGDFYFMFPADDLVGYDCAFCRPDELTYIDTEPEADTSDAVVPNTLAVGSEWDDEEALSRACKESGRDHITVTSCDGRVSVWDEGKGDWRVCYPLSKYAPFTVLHEGTSALWSDR